MTAKSAKVKATTTKKAVAKVSVKKAVTKVTKKVDPKVPKKQKSEKKSVKLVKKEKDSTLELVEYAIKGILEKKGKNIACLNLKDIATRVCDYFIICEGDSTTQVSAIASSIEEEVKKGTGEKPYHSEGQQNSEWILIDYINVVVHVFQPQIRSFYNLESLWADAEEVKFDAMVKIK